MLERRLGEQQETPNLDGRMTIPRFEMPMGWLNDVSKLAQLEYLTDQSSGAYAKGNSRLEYIRNKSRKTIY